MEKQYMSVINTKLLKLIPKVTNPGVLNVFKSINYTAGNGTTDTNDLLSFLLRKVTIPATNACSV